MGMIKPHHSGMSKNEIIKYISKLVQINIIHHYYINLSMQLTYEQ